MTDIFPQINIRLQTTDWEILENTMQDNCKTQQKPNNDNKNLSQGISCLNFWKSTIKKKIMKEVRRENILPN